MEGKRYVGYGRRGEKRKREGRTENMGGGVACEMRGRGGERKGRERREGEGRKGEGGTHRWWWCVCE